MESEEFGLTSAEFRNTPGAGGPPSPDTLLGRAGEYETTEEVERRCIALQ